MDLPYQMTRIRTEIDELKIQLNNTKLNLAGRSEVKVVLDHKKLILGKLEELNKQKHRKMGAYTGDEEKSLAT